MGRTEAGIAAAQERDTLTVEDVKMLAGKTPEDRIAWMVGHYNRDLRKTEVLCYVPWPEVCGMLDAVDPGWGHTVQDVKLVPVSQEKTLVFVLASITVKGVTRFAAAGETLAVDAFDRVAGVETIALKRAAAKFGVGRDLYINEDKILRTREEAEEKAKARDDEFKASKGWGGGQSGGGQQQGSGGGGAGRTLTDPQKNLARARAKYNNFGEGDTGAEALFDAIFGDGMKTIESAFTKAEFDQVAGYGK